MACFNGVAWGMGSRGGSVGTLPGAKYYRGLNLTGWSIEWFS